jgi:transcriptional regulator with XRE-family HTH domain
MGPQHGHPAPTPAPRDSEGTASASIGSSVFAGLVADRLANASQAASPSPTTCKSAPRFTGNDPLGALHRNEPGQAVVDPREDGTFAANDEWPADEVSQRVNGRTERATVTNVIAPRLVAARRMSGLQQAELAHRLGYKNSTQLSQWEMGRRPLPMVMLIRIAEALGVSADFLLGLTNEVDRDPDLARRTALHRSVRGQLDAVVDALVTTFEEHSALETPVATSQLVRAAEQLVSAVNGFIDANEDAFLDMPRGAPVAHALRQLSEVTAAARDRMQRHLQFEAELNATLKEARFGS